MTRHRPSGSRSHKAQRLFSDCYRISWVVDRYYQGSRLRFPTRYSRDTDEEGARRFCKKWGVEFPGEKK